MSYGCFSESVYNTVGRILGYGLAPLSVMGLGLPLYLRTQAGTQKVLGLVHLVLCFLTILCNAYLICRRKRLGNGASMFPILVTLTAVPAFFLLLPPLGFFWSTVMVVSIVAFDFLGQPILARFFCRAAGLTGGLRIDCF